MRALPLLLTFILALTSISFLGAQNPAQDKAERAKQAQLDKVYRSAKSTYAKKKTDANKKSLVTATFNLAEWYMYTPVLTPKDKYPAALRYYREVLKLEPQHKQAKASQDTIIQIYKSMGRPVPK
ncbi:MAG TPA: hypothetical protein PLO61_08380 [Fimbriimonadaceae bacterium]|nr:hypothetical protein [Fimbriimonadaceae bacterium]HRJ33581.1 hypothetical protein [Fimbriimonadaceae bacterium]